MKPKWKTIEPEKVIPSPPPKELKLAHGIIDLRNNLVFINYAGKSGTCLGSIPRPKEDRSESAALMACRDAMFALAKDIQEFLSDPQIEGE
jgi:hypothetical protein